MTQRTITVIKKNLQRVETWRYSGQILHQDAEKVILEAFFDRPDTPLYEMTLRQGDRFVETYYQNHWYNIFAIYDRDTNRLKGWYCNLSYPAEVKGEELSYVDLALDLLVYPDGRQLILDQDEYQKLDLPDKIRQQADSEFQELRRVFAERLIRPAPQ